MADEHIKPKKSWMKYLLIVSLGLNLLVVGLAIGAKMGGHGHRQALHARGSGLATMMRSLPDNKRKEVRKYFRENRDEMHANWDDMRKTMAKVRATIAAQPFDADALNAALAEQSAHIVAVGRDAQKGLTKIIAGMTDAERAEFVANMEEHHQKWEKRRKDKKKYE